MLCTLNRGVDALREQCECQATDMTSMTPEYTSPEISSPNPSTIFNTDYSKETEYTTPEYTSWETSKSYPSDSSTEYPEACYRQCPNWTTEFQNHCYFMVDLKTTWGDAGVRCGYVIKGNMNIFIIRCDIYLASTRN